MSKMTYVGDVLPVNFPSGKTLAVWVVPNVESFALERVVPGGSKTPFDLSAWSIREYGNRAGIWRMVELFDDLKIKPTVALNSDLSIAHPEIIEAGDAREWEWMGHGITNTDFSDGLSQDSERELITTSLDTIAANSRMRPVGWLTPHFSQNRITPHLLKEAGITYVTDWMVDDRVCSLHFDEGELIVLPYNLEINDKSCYESRGMTSGDFVDHVCRTFDQLYRESNESPVALSLPVHTYLTGYPGRIGALREILEHMLSYDGVWMATGKEIVDTVVTKH